MLRFILKLNETKKTTVILTTHDMQDIEALARRIILIGKGRILSDGFLLELKQQFPNEESLDEMIASLYRRYQIS